MSSKDLETLVAFIGANDGANKGFWRIQPRDRSGRWIIMGAAVKAMFRDLKNDLKSIAGRYVGPTGRPGEARVMVKGEKDIPDGVYTVQSHNLETFKAKLPESFLEEKGLPLEYEDIQGNRRSLDKESIPALEDFLATREDITPNDERLAKGELTDEEKEAEQAGREESPLADLPGGFESLNPDEAREMLRESGIDPNEFDPEKTETSSSSLGQKIKNFLTAKKSKMKKPTLTRYSKFAPFDVGNMRVGGYQLGEFKYVDADGNSQQVEVQKFDNGNMIVTFDRGPDEKKVEVYKNEQTNKWGIYRKTTGERALEGGELLEEFDSEEEARDALLSNVADELGFDSGSDSFNLSEGRIALSKRNNNPRTKRKVDDINLKPSEEYNDLLKEAEESSQSELFNSPTDLQEPDAEAVADKIMSEAIYGGEVPNVDEALAPLSREISPSDDDNIREVKPIDLNPGDVLKANNGDNHTLVDIKFDNAANKARLTLQDENGNTFEADIDSAKDVKVVRNARRPVQRPAAPTTEPEERPAEPEEVDTPEEAPEIQPEEVADEIPVAVNLLPANFPPQGRIDDGENIELTPLDPEEKLARRQQILQPMMDSEGNVGQYVDENNNVVEAEDPFAIMNALASAYPDAKFSEDGMSLIMHREQDKDGRIFEVRANNSGKRALVYSMRFTDPETGEFEEFMYKNDSHSISSALGAYDAEYILDRVLGRSPKNENLTFGSGAGENSATMDDTLYKRAKVGFMGPKDPSNTRRKFVTSRENAIRLADGRPATYHKDEKTIKDSAIPSLWEGFDELKRNPADEAVKDDFYQILYSIFGRMPMGEKPHADARRAIRDAYKIRFPESTTAETRSFNGLVTSASERLRGIYRNSDAEVRSIRYSSKDRSRDIRPDMVVEYTNNVGDTSTLRVTNLVQNTGASNGASTDFLYNYGDYVVAVDSAGNKIRINSLKLKILENQSSDLSVYIPNLRGEALRQRRISMGEVPPPSPLAPEPVGTRTIVSNIPEGPKLVDDFITGEVLYSRSGAPIGEILSVKPITSRDGKEGLAFLVKEPSGEEVRINYALGTELNPSLNDRSSRPLSREIDGPTNETATSRPRLHPDSDPDFDADEDIFEQVERPQTPSDAIFNLLNALESRGTVGNFSAEKFKEYLNDKYQTGSLRENIYRESQENSEVDQEVGKIFRALESDSRNYIDGYTLGLDSVYDKSVAVKRAVNELINFLDFQDDEDLKKVLKDFNSSTGSQAVTNVLASAIDNFINSDGATNPREIAQNQFKNYGVVLGKNIFGSGTTSNNPFSRIEVPVSFDEAGRPSINFDSNRYEQALQDLQSNGFFIYNDTNVTLSIAQSKDDFFEIASRAGGLSSEDTYKNRTTGISYRSSDGTQYIAINDELLNELDPEENSKFGGTPLAETLAHEMGHTVHRGLSPDWELPDSDLNNNYQPIFESEDITSYAGNNFVEHFGENFARYIISGQASPEFTELLEKDFGFSKVDASNYPRPGIFTDELNKSLNALSESLEGQYGIKVNFTAHPPAETVDDYVNSLASGRTAGVFTNSRRIDVSVINPVTGSSRSAGNAMITYQGPRGTSSEELIFNGDLLNLSDAGVAGYGLGPALFESIGGVLGNNGGGKLIFTAGLENGPYTWALNPASRFSSRDTAKGHIDRVNQIKPYASFFAKYRDKIRENFNRNALSSTPNGQTIVEQADQKAGDPSNFSPDVYASFSNPITPIFDEILDNIGGSARAEWDAISVPGYDKSLFLNNYIGHGWDIDDTVMDEINVAANSTPSTAIPAMFANIGRTKKFGKSYSSIGRYLMMSYQLTRMPGWSGFVDIPNMSRN